MCPTAPNLQFKDQICIPKSHCIDQSYTPNLQFINQTV